MSALVNIVLARGFSDSKNGPMNMMMIYDVGVTVHWIASDTLQ